MASSYGRIGALVGLAALLGATEWSLGQQPAPAAAPPSQGSQSMASSSLSSSLGVYAFPAKNQTADQQHQDESYCYSWAKSQTGIDPAAPPPQQAAAPPPQSTESAGSGSRARGAARGAAGGAIIGAVTGNAGGGAAIGATVGTMAGGRQKRQAEAQAQAQQAQAQQDAANQHQAQIQQQRATYKKAYSACMQGKGYTVQ